MLRRERGQVTARCVGVLVGVVLLAGCGSADTSSGDSRLGRAERALQAELEEAADHLGIAAEPGERVPPTRCDDSGRAKVTGGYRIRLELSGHREPLLRRAARFWRARDRRVRVMRGRFPAVFATADPGWTFALQLFPERGEALLSGGTPCLPEPHV
jgi:hypothetical protein